MSKKSKNTKLIVFLVITIVLVIALLLYFLLQKRDNFSVKENFQNSKGGNTGDTENTGTQKPKGSNGGPTKSTTINNNERDINNKNDWKDYIGSLETKDGAKIIPEDHVVNIKAHHKIYIVNNIQNEGTIVNHARIIIKNEIVNNGIILNYHEGEIINTYVIINNKTILNYGLSTINNNGAINNNGTIKNMISATIQNKKDITNFNSGSILNDVDAGINNNGDIINDGTIDNIGIIENMKLLLNSGKIKGNGILYSHTDEHLRYGSDQNLKINRTGKKPEVDKKEVHNIYELKDWEDYIGSLKTKNGAKIIPENHVVNIEGFAQEGIRNTSHLMNKGLINIRVGYTLFNDDIIESPGEINTRQLRDGFRTRIVSLMETGA